MKIDFVPKPLDYVVVERFAGPPASPRPDARWWERARFESAQEASNFVIWLRARVSEASKAIGYETCWTYAQKVAIKDRGIDPLREGDPEFDHHYRPRFGGRFEE